MAVTTANVFSEYEVKNTSIKFNGESAGQATKVGCVGTLEETLNAKTVTKSCEGVVVKTVVKGDGTGELKLTLHMVYDLYLKSYGMVSEQLADGVFAYGRNSKHQSMCITMEVLDEDGNKKLRAYPNCVITGGDARKIENGAEEVAEMEITISIMPDEQGNGMYEALVTDTLSETIVEGWLTSFNYELVKKVQA